MGKPENIQPIILADGEDFSALTLVAALHWLREHGEVTIKMQGGKVPGISSLAIEVLNVQKNGKVLFYVEAIDELRECIDSVWQESLV